MFTPAPVPLSVIESTLCAAAIAGEDPARLARKLLRVNLSDLAAKGAEPFAAFLAVAWPAAWTPDDRATFAAGLGEDLKTFGVALVQGDDGRIRFPRALVEDMLAVAARNITLHARDPKHDLHLSGSNVHYGTAGAAVHIVDPITLDYRDSTAQDLYDAARLVDNLDNIHFYQRTMVCRDVIDNKDMDLNTLYGCLSGTAKHVGTSFSDPSHVADCFDMIYTVAGGEEKWLERPFVSNSNCFVVPPMKFAEESCITMEDCIRRGMPMLLLSAGQAGATAPAPTRIAILS